MELLQRLVWIAQTPESHSCVAQGPDAKIGLIESDVGAVLPRVIRSHGSLEVFSGCLPLSEPEREESQVLVSTQEQTGVLQTPCQAQTLGRQFACRLILRP